MPGGTGFDGGDGSTATRVNRWLLPDKSEDGVWRNPARFHTPLSSGMSDMETILRCQMTNQGTGENEISWFVSLSSVQSHTGYHE
jgi:hypothetical protein